MTSTLRLGLLVAATLLLLLAQAPPAVPVSAAQPPDGPRLLVVLVVDQLRQDYLARMAPLWTRGMKRLLTEGAVFERNFYPYLQTVTCAGHATIGTGSYPSTHGIILNAWWRGTRSATCTEDPGAQPVGYEPGIEAVGHSAVQLLVPTMADRLRSQSAASRVVSLSTKPRSAIMMAGTGGVVTWTDDHNRWATSTAFATTPDADVQAFVQAHPRAALRDHIWVRLLDEGRYTGLDRGVGEKPPTGWTAEFPHPLAGAPGTAEDQLYTLWEHSPYSDDYLGAMAADLVARKKLGQGAGVDFLGVSLSALDYVGHKFGPESHEVQDTLLRLDVSVGNLLDALDRHVGRGRYLVGLTADHGVAPIPEARVAAGADAGRVPLQRLVQTANAPLVELLGPGQHVARADYTQIYLSPAAQQRVLENPGLLRPVVAALERIPGIARAIPSAGLERQKTSTEPDLRAAALSYVPGRSGQIVVVPKPFHVIGGSDATTHGTHHEYDQHVPLIFFGTGVRPGRYQGATSPADLAPTLASRIGLPLPGADGTAQTAIFERR
jgi:predicted AlkP superfamily pyrophosphatase or phosphodiesterase